MKRIFATAVILAAALAGCRAQQPVTTWQVNVTWTAPAACTISSPCTFPVSRAAVASATASCPATTGTTYTLVGTSASQASAFVDTTVAPGAFYCYIAQTQQAGATGDPSLPSNVVTVPLNPGVPTAPVATVQVH